MAHVVFTAHLRQHVDCPEQDVEGTNVREILQKIFDANPRLRGYVLDDQSTLRHHVNIFVDGEMIQDREGLTDRVSHTSEVYVLQALSGGSPNHSIKNGEST